MPMLKKLVVGVAILSSLWATYTTFVYLRLGRMIFVDCLLPRQSFDAFLREIPNQVRDDVMTGHERGLRMVAIPLIAMAICWFGAYILTERQRKTGQ